MQRQSQERGRQDTVTTAISSADIAGRINKNLPGTPAESKDLAVFVMAASLPAAAAYLKNTSGLDFDYLVSLTAVDYWDYFDMVYHLASVEKNHSLTLKVRCQGRDNLHVPSVMSVWQSADYQEREVYDMFGIKFDGRPDIKRLFMWDGFQGYPLRRDYL